MATWERLIRFEDDSGNVRFGEPIVSDASEVHEFVSKGSLEAKGFEGSSPFDVKPSGITHKVKKLLGVLTPDDVPVVKAAGLNYLKHVKEAGRDPPPFPHTFIKARTAVANFDDDIPVAKMTQKDQVDYEVELCIVIGKTCKNVSRTEALNYVAGYVAGNDFSARTWQNDPAFNAGVCFAKGFDKWAPLSPILVSPKVVGNANGLQLQTWVNGDIRQDGNTNDMIFGIEYIIEFLSQGTTLEKGTVIMTGTPAGVILGMKNPIWLKDGDIVEIKIEKVGSLKNKIVFE